MKRRKGNRGGEKKMGLRKRGRSSTNRVEEERK
jgi:hypothetical protein